MRAKTCRGCGDKFAPDRPLQVVCCVPCAWAYKAKEEAKTDRRLTREAKAKLKTRRDWFPLAQEAFNKYIRLRDAADPCISCGRVNVERTTGGAWDCGHYLGRGAYPELRFEPLNAHKQCKKCNGGSGKYAKKDRTVKEIYRINLIAKIGLESVEWLEGPHEPKHYTVDDLKQIKAHYTALVKQLINDGTEASGLANFAHQARRHPISGEMEGE